MHSRGVAARHPVGEHHIPPTARFRGFDQPDAFGQQGGLSGGGHTHHQRFAHVQATGEYRASRLDRDGQALAGDQAGIQRGCATLDYAVRAHTLPGPDQKTLARRHRFLRPARRAAVIRQHRDIAHPQGQQLLRHRPRPPAGQMIEIAADQQEEQQRHGAVEIGVGAAGEALLNADAGDQDHADADRHVHVGPQLPQGGERRGKKRHASIGDRRQRDQRGDEMHQFPRGGPHALYQAGPDAD